MLYPVGVGSYAVGACAGRRAAVAGLGAFLAAYPVYAFEDPGVRGHGAGGQWAAAFFGAAAIVLIRRLLDAQPPRGGDAVRARRRA